MEGAPAEAQKGKGQNTKKGSLRIPEEPATAESSSSPRLKARVKPQDPFRRFSIGPNPFILEAKPPPPPYKPRAPPPPYSRKNLPAVLVMDLD